jgi:hypothetical protein
LAINFKKDREGFEADSRNLAKCFERYKNCEFKEYSDVNREMPIEKVLSKEGLRDIFASDVTPDVFILFILAHGDEDGRILTDNFYTFTTFEVWDALKNNKSLNDCVKINFFGVIFLLHLINFFICLGFVVMSR